MKYKQSKMTHYSQDFLEVFRLLCLNELFYWIGPSVIFSSKSNNLELSKFVETWVELEVLDQQSCKRFFVHPAPLFCWLAALGHPIEEHPGNLTILLSKHKLAWHWRHHSLADILTACSPSPGLWLNPYPVKYQTCAHAPWWQ